MISTAMSFSQPVLKCSGPSYLITLSFYRSGWVTGAMFTAKAAGQLPMVSLTLITTKSEHIWQTNTLASDTIAWTGIAVCTENIAHTS